MSAFKAAARFNVHRRREESSGAGGERPRRPPRDVPGAEHPVPAGAAQGDSGEAPRGIDHLRRENKELLYKRIMEPIRRKGLDAKQQALKSPAKGSEAHTGVSVQEQHLDMHPSQEKEFRILGLPRPDCNGHGRGLLIASLQPLRIRHSPSHPAHAPTPQDCEVIIRQLHRANALQSQEITRTRKLLRDVVLGKNYNLTKAQLLDETNNAFEVRKLPKLGLQSFPEKISGPFPALKRNLMTLRQRKAPHGDRLKRTPLS
ncbi:hypothetical protein OJAV_G00118510 [Oryzias javanicus]|uniref:Coiled coil protein 74 C-terminal domain-containing protein n=1 Tax=Oryzias javanicus TaxID=123683 RepID=A0A3S2PNF1_ORYJA|nr:hypothetical protein OJAV_G00118510 [Oryzias javanicus]